MESVEHYDFLLIGKSIRFAHLYPKRQLLSSMRKAVNLAVKKRPAAEVRY